MDMFLRGVNEILYQNRDVWSHYLSVKGEVLLTINLVLDRKRSGTNVHHELSRILFYLRIVRRREY